MHRKKLLALLVIILAIAAAFVFYRHAAAPSKSSQATVEHTGQPKFNKKRYSTTDPSSLWIVVNKQHPLTPQNYAPTDLVTPNVPLRVPGNESMEVRKVVVGDMEALFTAAKAQQVPLMLSSGYRSYAYQTSLYNGYVNSSGKVAADTYSARPGYSEHQTGLAFDVEPLDQQCDVDQCFANLPAGKWIAAHAYEYGFLLRYPADKVAVTGYMYEPWHLRYIGKPLAAELHKDHIETLEEFFGLPAAPDYGS